LANGHYILLLYKRHPPEGNFKELKEEVNARVLKKDESVFLSTLKDYRVWILFGILQLVLNRVDGNGTMDDYLQNRFGLDSLRRKFGTVLCLIEHIWQRNWGAISEIVSESPAYRGRVNFSWP